MKLIYPRLPEGYTELEYIESTGTQYIDLGIKGNQDMSAEIVISPASELLLTGVFGSRTNGAGVDNFSITFGATAGSVNVDFGNYENYRATAALTPGSKYTFKTSKSGRYIYDASGEVIASNTRANETTFTTPKNLLIGSIGTDETTFNGFIGKLFPDKVWSSATLVGNIIPAQRNSDSAVGMYDLVTDTFLPNAGTGAFVAGPKLHFVKGVGEILHINLWDEQWESGTYDKDTGEKKPQAGAFRSVDYIAVNPSTEYYCFCGSQGIRVYYYQEDKTYIGTALADDSTITTPSNCHFMSFYSGISTYNHDICINLSDPDVNGHYYPYAKPIKSIAIGEDIIWQVPESDQRTVREFIPETDPGIYEEEIPVSDEPGIYVPDSSDDPDQLRMEVEENEPAEQS